MIAANGSATLFHPVGALTGLLFGAGVVLIIWRVLAMRTRLVHRLEPYLREPRGQSTLLASSTPFPQLEALLKPIIGDIGRLLDRLGSQTNSVRQRLLRSGTSQTVEAFRVEQIIWATVALGITLVSALFLATTRSSNPIVLLVMVGIGTLCGPLARDYLLTRHVRKREQVLATEFPTIAELLALAVSAGETPLAALERVTSSTSGELSDELKTTLADVRSGVPLPEALTGLAHRTEVSVISRFTDGVATAIERGTPLSEVLRAQAEDARDGSHQELLEAGGKKEIMMMIPVVFLLLPITVLFALFPGLQMLSMT